MIEGDRCEAKELVDTDRHRKKKEEEITNSSEG